MQVNTDVLDTVLLSLHPAEVLANEKVLFLPTILLKVVEANHAISQRTKKGLAELHRSPDVAVSLFGF